LLSRINRQEVIAEINNRGTRINRFFTRTSDLSNFPAHTGFLVMAIKKNSELIKPISRAESV
jgi:hypothetical protein